MDNEQQTAIYSTLDAYQAAFLKINGFEVTLRKSATDHHKVVFIFTSSLELNKTLNAYHSGTTVNALIFANVIKTLKSQVLSMKRSDGDGKSRSKYW